MFASLIAFAAVVTLASAGQVGPRDEPFEIDWYTIDGGGEMFSTGGDFELSGTIGQPDANVVVMTGGDFELLGGFWADPCIDQLRGDANCDGSINILDIDVFVLALIDPEGYNSAYAPCTWNCACDMNYDGSINSLDIDPFVDLLTGG